MFTSWGSAFRNGYLSVSENIDQEDKKTSFVFDIWVTLYDFAKNRDLICSKEAEVSIANGILAKAIL